MTTPAVEVTSVGKRFGDHVALHAIDLNVNQGEFVSLLGPSGCGKTTLLRIISGFETPTHGRVLIHGTDVTAVPPHRRPTNIVFQRGALFPHMNVFDNIAYSLKLRKWPKARIATRVEEMLALVRLDGLGGRGPTELSGGQIQRAALARALAPEPSVLLLDEPLSALDLKLRQHMQLELRAIQRKLGATFVYVTHDQGEALAMSDRMAKRTFDAAISALGTDPSPATVRQNWGGAGAVVNGGPNHSGYASATFDALIDTATTATAPAASHEYFRRAYRVINDDVPAIWLYEPRMASIAHTRLQLTRLRADAWWAGLADWSIPPGQRIARDKIGAGTTAK